MTYYTHVAGGIIAGTIVIKSGIPNIDSAIVMGSAVVGSLLPDIDHTRSKISKTSTVTLAFSHLIGLFTKHRGIIHTPVFIAAVWILMSIAKPFIPAEIQPYFSLIIMGLIPGMLSHIALDTLNPGGIMWIFPVNQKYYHIANVKTGSIFETLVAVIMIFFIAVMYKII